MLRSTILFEELLQVCVLKLLLSLNVLLLEELDLTWHANRVELCSLLAFVNCLISTGLVENFVGLNHEGLLLHDIYCVACEFYPVVTFVSLLVLVQIGVRIVSHHS